MNKSETIGELAKALSLAQGEFTHVPLNSVNPFLKNRYADLGSVIATVRPTLSAHGLAFVQQITGNGGTVGVTTTLMHASGEWLEETVSLPVGDEKGLSSSQSAGKIITYLRRYTLTSLLGVYADEDDDSPPSSAQKDTKAPKKTPKPAAETEPLPAIVCPEHLGTIVNSSGVRYVDLPNDKLAYMANAITKAEKKNGLDDEQRFEYAVKRDAIREILALRNARPAADDLNVWAAENE